MNFISSLLLLAALISAFLLPYFAGHGIGSHQNSWIGIGVVFGVISAVLFLLTKKVAPKDVNTH